MTAYGSALADISAEMVAEIEDRLTEARDRLWRQFHPEAELLGDLSEVLGPFRFARPAPVGPDQRPPLGLLRR